MNTAGLWLRADEADLRRGPGTARLAVSPFRVYNDELDAVRGRSGLKVQIA